MFFKKLRFVILVALGIGLYSIPVSFVSEKAWHLFSIFSLTILGVILQVYPIACITLLGLTAILTLNLIDIDQALSGFSTSTIWLVGSIFFISRGIMKTKLGERIAYLLIYFIGSTPLKLAYIISSVELLFAPVIPSNTARAGGIMMPIVKAVAQTLGEDKENISYNEIRSFLVQVAFHANVITSAMFLTAMVGNPLAQSLAKTKGVVFNWIDWFAVAIVPGLISLATIPFFIFKLKPLTQQSALEVRLMAKEKLESIGRFAKEEKIMGGILILMLILWVLGDKFWNIHPVSTAILGICLCLLTKIIDIEDMLKEYNAWSTILWLSILITMSTSLEQYGFISFISQKLAVFVNSFSFYNAILTLLLIYFGFGYLFAGNSAHISALYTAFLTVLISIGSPPILSALLLAFLSNLYSSLTPYGSTVGSLYFATNYVSTKTWWTQGLLVGLINLLIWLGVGIFWWKLIGYL